MTYAEWEQIGLQMFGSDKMQWRFVCPVCRYVQTPEQYRAAGAPLNVVAFSCVGRWVDDSQAAFERNGRGPCNYAGGGLFRLNPIEVDGQHYFDFAPVDEPVVMK